MKIRRIGIVLETREEAETQGQDLETLYHWREPDEIAAIRDAIERAGYAVEIIGTPRQLAHDLPRIMERIDFIFNLSVGFISRSRMALGSALYELADLPFSGADAYARMLSQNKHLLKSFMINLGLPTPPWVYLERPDDLRPDLPGYPLIVKPAHEGSSIGITADSVVTDFNTLQRRVGRLFSELQMPVLVEQFIAGRELKVGFIGSGRPRFRGIIEDVDHEGAPLGERLLYFDVKTGGRFSKQALDIEEPRYRQLLADCERLYEHTQPLDFGLFDIRIDGDGNHYLIEFNTDATLHPERSLARCCALNGVPFDTMIEMILDSAFERQGLTDDRPQP